MAHICAFCGQAAELSVLNPVVCILNVGLKVNVR